MRRPLLVRLCSAVAIASALALSPAPARAQVSDAQRAAARQLFQEGNDLQAAGRYADALSKFQKAQDAFSAPTNLVRVAQCQVALGRLVEAAETYRTIIRTPLPAGSPPAFAQAVEQAKTELSQVEPRVPKVVVAVTPADAANLRLQIDGQPVSAALVGEALPLDPGTHKVAVSAPGYVVSEQTVTLAERDAKTLTFRLRAASGDVVVPAPAPLPPPAYGDGAQPEPVPAPPPPVETEFVTRRRLASRAFLLGAHAGVAIPSGDFAGGSLASGGSDSISNLSATGGTVGVDAGIRFSRFYFGLTADYSGYSRGNTPSALVGNATADQTVTLSSYSGYFGLAAAYISNPHGVGFYGELGLGYRWMTVDGKVSETAAAANYVEEKITFGGGELELGAGVYIRASRALVLVPKATVSIGSFENATATCTAGGAGTCASSAMQSGSITDTAAHAFVFLGVAGFYDIDIY